MRLPYSGSYGNYHKPNSDIIWYGGDCLEYYQDYLAKNSVAEISPEDRVDGEWGYHFNAQGYRGEDWDAAADFTLALFGCSIGFGEGVKWEQTWGSVLRDAICATRGFSKGVCLNFSQSGAANDYITRTAIRQSSVEVPSLLIAYFTHTARREVFENGVVHSFGSWNADSSELFQSILGCYTEDEALLNTFKNMAMLQLFCLNRSIPYYFILQEREKIDLTKLSERAGIGDYINLIDWSHVADFRIRWVDRGRDNRHPGPRSQREFAQRVLERVLALSLV